MKIKTISDTLLNEPDRVVHGKGFTSIRLLLERDGMGFSLHQTIIPKGGPYHWHYKHHLEACYCVSGVGELVNLDSGDVYFIEKDTLYVLDNHDNHTFKAHTEVVLISIFNPPVTGNEVHDSDGSYKRISPNYSEIYDSIVNSPSKYEAIELLKSMIK